MSKKFSASMFDELKNVMAEQRSGGNFKDILKTIIGKNYIVRLIPNTSNISDTMYHYFSHGWKSLSTGQFISCICPTTIGNRCPVCEERMRLYGTGDQKDKETAKKLSRKEQWLINAYVIDDPVNTENNNTIKIVRYGKQLDKVIRDATEGIDKNEFGSKVFDLTEDGCNLRIVVEKNDGGYPSYTSSKFLRESKIDGMNEEKIEEVYKTLFQLDKMFEIKSTDEIVDILNTHLFCQLTPIRSVDETRNEQIGTELNNTGAIIDNTEDTDDEPIIDNSDVDDSNIADDDIQNKLDDLMKNL